MIQLVCLNGEIFADHDADLDVPLDAYPDGCTVVPWPGSLGSLSFVEPAPQPGQPDLRRRRNAPVLTKTEDLKAYAASLRYYRCRQGVSVGGVRYGTDDAAEAKLLAKAPIFEADAKASVSWKSLDGFVSLDAALYKAVKQAVTEYREACFAAEAKADIGIADGSIATMAAVEAVIAAADA